ncbi:hypothetical protein HYPSUDRAFT_54038 [Hypholoma sublateritium FD-334 SS-4]|uniref:Uncharacterized protein n=1 Tax=Hypholoma sublateritium (strain FD-334 SS-4) TaxID=945553 RepID=A0A0D2P5B0_HYPSF|nr:hypothetical protein HYPSUDRAFT_54038 [Hypholoma sublateritium FD-334 SS-4]
MFLYSKPERVQNCAGTVGLAYNNVVQIIVKTDGYTVTPPLENIVDCVMSRYPQHPLSIEIYDWKIGRISLDSGCIDQRILMTLAAYLEFFYTVVHRWQHVRFDGPLISIIAPMTKKFPSAGPTMLEGVAVKHTDSVRNVDVLRKFMSALWSGKSWAFSQFFIENYTVFDKQIFRDLPYARLTQLEVQSTVTAALVHEILAEAFGMVKCTISDVTGPCPSERRLCAHTPNLEYLNLEIDTMDFDKSKRTGAVFSVLNKLVAPALTELRLGYEDAWNSQVFNEFCARSAFQLEVLHLVKMAMKPRHLAHTLSMNPTVHELVVEGQIKGTRRDQNDILFTEELLAQLLVSPQGNHLSPDLDSLTVNICTVQAQNGAFRRMVRDRFRNSNLRQVKIIGAQYLSEKDHTALVELASYRMSVWLDSTRVVDPRWHW